MNSNIPTIKGIFVRSHIERIKKEKGEEGVRLLEEKFGKPLVIKNTDNVPIKDEVHLLECAVELLSNESLSGTKLSYEAGRLHFTNFLTTPLAKILFPFFKSQFKMIMLQTRNIAGHVFEGITFTSVDLGENGVKVILTNNDYPIEHFQGFFQEWLNYSELHGTVEAVKVEDAYEYTIRW